MLGFNIIIPRDAAGKVREVITFPLPTRTESLVLDEELFTVGADLAMRTWADVSQRRMRFATMGGAIPAPEMLLLVHENSIMAVLLSFPGRIEGTLLTNPPKQFQFTKDGATIDLSEYFQEGE